MDPELIRCRPTLQKWPPSADRLRELSGCSIPCAALWPETVPDFSAAGYMVYSSRAQLFSTAFMRCSQTIKIHLWSKTQVVFYSMIIKRSLYVFTLIVLCPRAIVIVGTPHMRGTFCAPRSLNLSFPNNHATEYISIGGNRCVYTWLGLLIQNLRRKLTSQ